MKKDDDHRASKYRGLHGLVSCPLGGSEVNAAHHLPCLHPGHAFCRSSFWPACGPLPALLALRTCVAPDLRQAHLTSTLFVEPWAIQDIWRGFMTCICSSTARRDRASLFHVSLIAELRELVQVIAAFPSNRKVHLLAERCASWVRCEIVLASLLPNDKAGLTLVLAALPEVGAFLALDFVHSEHAITLCNAGRLALCLCQALAKPRPSSFRPPLAPLPFGNCGIIHHARRRIWARCPLALILILHHLPAAHLSPAIALRLVHPD